MSHTFHCHLRKSLRWYNNWHNHPHYQHTHWAFFVSISLLLFSFISGGIHNFYSENEQNNIYLNIARAQYNGPPPYGLACRVGGNIVPGYIFYGGSNASIGDLAQDGYFCDDDPPEASQVSYPVSGTLYCEGSSAVSFAFNGDPCNCRPRDGSGCHYNSSQPYDPLNNNPGWYFDGNGWPINVTLLASAECRAGQTSTPITLNGPANVGAFHNSLYGAGFLCIPGTATDATPTPTPEPRFIYYIQPYSILAGQSIKIIGANLTPNVSFTNPLGTVTQATGTSDNEATEISVTVPASLAPGLYALTVGPDPDSNAVEIEILPGTYIPNPPGAQTPVILSINPTILTQGDNLEINGEFLTSIVQLTGADGVITALTGTVSPDYKTTMVTIPTSVSPGIYNVAVTGPYGTGTSPDVLTVVELGGPGANADPVTIPPATDFQDLISNAFNYSLILVGIAVFIMIMWGGFLWLTSAANPGNIGTAKRYITNALIGAALLVSAYVILFTINPELVNGTFTLPGMKAPVPLPPEDCSNPQTLAERYGTAYPQPIPPNNQSTSWGGAPELDTLINCVLADPNAGPMIDRNQIYTYQQNGQFNCNYTRGNACGPCEHTANSCHYGGYKGNSGSLAVDFNSINGSANAEGILYQNLLDIYSSCGMGYILFENNHTHVSTVSCPGN